MTADVTGAEEELSQPEGATQLEATMAPQTDVSREGQGIPLGVSHLAERSVGEVSWDRFRTGTIIGPDPEPKQSSRPSTPPNLIRTLQVSQRVVILFAPTRLHLFKGICWTLLVFRTLISRKRYPPVPP